MTSARAAPVPPDEAARLEVLRRTALLDTPPEKQFDDLARLAAFVARTPIALVSLVDCERQWFKARVGLEATETPRDVAFCAHAILSTRPLIVRDADADPRFADNPLVQGPPSIGFYAGFPLTMSDGHRLGTLCVLDRVPRELEADQVSALELLRDRVVAAISSGLLVRELERIGEDGWDFLQNAGDMVQIVDREGRLVYVNSAWSATLGWSLAEARGRSVFDMIAPDHHSYCQSVLASLESGIAPPTIETVFVARDGRRLHVEGTATMRAITGTTRGVFRDVTARVLAHAELQRGQRLLQRAHEELEERVQARTLELTRANQDLRAEMRHREQAEASLRKVEEELRHSGRLDALGRMAGGVAHDFNNVITAVLGYSDRLLERMRDEDLRQEVEQIHRAGERAVALTRQLLAFARKQILQPRPFDLNEGVADVVKMLQRLLGDHVQLKLDLEAGPKPVLADPGQLEQVIVNLAVNARDAMPGGGRITISTRTVSPEDAALAELPPALARSKLVLLSVSDTGVGIAPDVLPRVFEPFFTTKPAGAGTGLGLAMVHGIVLQSGGHAAVRSELGKGSTFLVYLPWVTSAATPGAAAQSRGSGGTETVLLIEDDDSVRGLLKMGLEAQGYTVLTSADGMEAQSVAAAHPGCLDLVVTDMVMPNMCGREAVIALRRARPGVRALFMSGAHERVLALPDGYEPVLLEKPFTPAALAAKVREILDRPAGCQRRAP